MDPKEQRLINVAKRVGAFKAARDALDHAVKLARDEGASWSEVAMATGVTKQGAQQRWG